MGGGADASLLAQKFDGCSTSEESLRTSPRVLLAAILFAGEVLRDLGTFSFVASHLFYVINRHLSAVTELLRLIESLEDIQNNMQGMI